MVVPYLEIRENHNMHLSGKKMVFFAMEADWELGVWDFNKVS